MFKRILSVAVMATALFFTSCEKENINADPNHDSNSSFLWPGTPPFSLQLNGTYYVAPDYFVRYAYTPGFHNLIVYIDNTQNIVISVPENAKAGGLYSFPNPANLTYTVNTNSSSYASTNGGCKIVTNNDELIEGYFFTDLKWVSGPNTGPKEIRNGYFKVNKK